MKTQPSIKTHTRRMVSLVLAVVGSILFMAVAASAKTITVTGTGDTIALDGKVTLREAITAANTNNASGDAPKGDPGLDTIYFNIPGGAFQTITLTSELPPTPEPLTIDGTSQPGYAGTPVIELSGNNVVDTGLFIYGGNSVVRGLVINRFKGIGILLSTKGGNFIGNNYIGTNASGTSALGNAEDGISIQASSSNNLIGGGSAATRNVISGNGSNGIGISSGSDSNTVKGNFIGTNAAGTASLGNSSYGIRIFSGGNVIGGAGAGESNVISGNNRGVSFEGVGATANLLQGNLIGTNADGTAALGNADDGVQITGPGNTVGAGLASGRNLISGNGGNGILINSSAATGNKVHGNLIGTNASGDAALGNGGNGVRIIGASNNTVGGLVVGYRNIISGNGRGVSIETAAATGNTVQGNFIGTNANGDAALGNNQEGVYLSGPNNLVGGTTASARNIVSGNRFGIYVSDNLATGNQIQGNYVGTNLNGDAPIGNTENGIVVYGGVNNSIGGTISGAGNVVSGNGGNGVGVYNCAGTANKIQGNFIGTNAAGTAALGNLGEGVRVIDSPKTLVGGTVPAARNIISGNNRGVTIEDASTGTLVQGNYIGTDITGSNGLGNNQEGVAVYSSSGNLIGGTVKGTRNVISGNDNDGVYISGGKTNLVQGNYIGTKADGVTALPNRVIGVDVYSSFNNTIGGTAPGAGNVIASNNYAGVFIGSGTGNAIEGNSIFNNARLGIDLDSTDIIGLLANDQGDPDLNANKRQNYPLLTSVTVNGGNTSIQGVFNSIPNKQFRLEFFANNVCNGSGFGEGQVFLGTASVTTDASGNGTINTTLPVAPAGQFITATATSAGGDTSEFSPCALVGGANPGVLQFESSFFIESEINGTAMITVTRSNGMLGAVTVHYATSDGTATTPADYADTSGTLTFGDGEVIKTFTVPLVNDGVPESQETFNLTLSAPTGGAGLGLNSTSKLYINNYDPAYPETNLSDVSIVEGNSGTTNAVFHITVTPHSQAVTIGYATADATAQAGSDYQATSGTFIFNPGETSKDVIVPIIGDTQVEGDELFFLNLTELSAGYVVKGQGEGTILEDEGLATLSLSAATYSVNENGGSVDVIVKRAGGSTPLSVDYMTSDGSAMNGSDYTAKTGTLSFNANETEKIINIPVINDALNESDETFNFKLSNPSNAVLGSPNAAVITIEDDDVASLSIGDVSSTEGNSGASNFIFSLTLSAASNQTVTVDYATAAGTATSGSDYQATSGTLTFNPGETSKTVTVLINGDTQDEPNETFIVNLSNPINATIGTGQGTGTIINDDSPAAPTVQFSSSDFSAQEDLTAATITVTRAGDASGTATVDYATADNTATQLGDYEIASGTLTFAPGQVSKTFQVLINEDSYVEGTENLHLVLSNATGAGLGAQATAFLNINDDAVEQSINPNDDAQNFVYQQYHDFLNREPDAGGLAYWTGQITQCGGDQACVNAKRKAVSAAFFIEQEFQQTGYFVYLMQKASYGTQPSYQRFMGDRNRVTVGPTLEQTKQAFADEWVQRAGFKTAYPDALTASQFVNQLYDTAGLFGYSAERQQAMQALNSNAKTRAQVLRDVIETPELKTREFNPSFVLMQYFGYLRREPDQGGYLFWLNILNTKLPQDPSGYHAMVCAFISSPEYQDRFSAIHTHSDVECGQ
jgi:hypothetical protein